MKNENYFTNIPNIGNLDLDLIFVEDICPIFFTLISKEQKRYIAVCCELYKEQRWIISSISNEKLTQMIKNKITMRDAFLNNEENIVAHWSKDNQILRYDIVDELPEGDLPLDEYLELEDDEITEYIKQIK